MAMTDNYCDGLEYLSAQYEEVSGYDFYRDIFPNNQNSGELHSAELRKQNDLAWIPNAIYLYRDEERDAGSKRRLRRRIMLNDTWEQDYADYVEGNPMTLCSGLAYRKRANILENAQRANALIFDLDGVGMNEFLTLFLRFRGLPTGIRTLPMPTHIVLSGSGVHLYYVFVEPIDLYPNIKLQMKQLKYALTFRMWDYKATSQQKQVQYQSINQGYRMVGSVNMRYGTEVKAFRVGERVTLEYLNQYVKPENRVDINRPFRPSKMTRAEAAEKYPEWYQRVVVERKKRPKKWNIAGQKGHNGDELYNWWLSKVDEVLGGHRYFFMMCLAVYASKCDIPKERLKKDMQTAFEILRKEAHVNDLTQEDVDSAMEIYSKEYYNFTIDDIEHLTNVRIERNKRNGRKQEQHIRVMNAVRDVIHPDGSWRNKEGRPSAAAVVLEYREKNPEAKKVDCHRATGLDPKTIRKWWNGEREEA